MTFEYMHEIKALDSIDVQDMGNVCLNAFNDEGQEWYLLIKTHLGWSTVKQFGPLIVDIETLPNFFDFQYTKLEYKESKLYSIIDGFINNPKRNITQVFFTSEEEIQDRLDQLQEDE